MPMSRKQAESIEAKQAEAEEFSIRTNQQGEEYHRSILSIGDCWILTFLEGDDPAYATARDVIALLGGEFGPQAYSPDYVTGPMARQVKRDLYCVPIYRHLISFDRLRSLAAPGCFICCAEPVIALSSRDEERAAALAQALRDL